VWNALDFSGTTGQWKGEILSGENEPEKSLAGWQAGKFSFCA
jgi:hypothetical protein